MARSLSAVLLAALLASASPAADEAPRTDLYGDPLPPGAVARLGTSRWRAGCATTVLVYSPNGDLVASAGRDRAVRLWEAATGRLLRTLWGHREEAVTLAFSPDGKRLASGGGDGTVRMWDVATGKELRRLAASDDGVALVGFGAAGKTLISVGLDGAARRWESETGEPRDSFPLPDMRNRVAALSPDGRRLAVGGERGAVDLTRIDLFDVEAGREVRSFARGQTGGDWAVFSPDGKSLATGARDNKIRFWDPATGELLGSLDGGSGAACLALSPDRKLLALEAEGDSNALALRDAATGRVLCTLRGHQHYTEALAFSPDGRTLLSAAGDMAIRRWDVETGRPVSAGDGHCGYAVSLAFSADGKRLASGAPDPAVRLWDSGTAKQVQEFEASPGVVQLAVALSADGKVLAAGGGDRVLRVWDAAGGRPVCRLEAPDESLALSADGNTLFAAGQFKAVRRWDLPSGKELAPLTGHEKWINRIAFSADGKTLVSAGTDGTARLWDAATGEELRRFDAHAGAVADAAFLPDGKAVVAACADGTVRLWDVGSGKEIRRWPTYHPGFRSVALSPDGKYLACADLSPVIGLWETATGRPLPPVVGHRGKVYQVAFSADGKTLASTGDDATVLLWDADRLLRRQRPPADALSPEQLELYWSDLGDAKEYRLRSAVEMLTAGGPATVDLIRRRLPAALDEAARVGRLIAKLDDDDFEVRQKASAELAKLGPAAGPVLRKTLEGSPSAEARQRVEALLAKLPKQDENGAVSEMQCALAALQVLEWIDDPDARRLLKEVADGPADSAAAKEAREILNRLAARPNSAP